MTIRLKGRKGLLRFDLDTAARALVPLAIGRMQQRTRAGLDVEGRPFKPYSPAYAARLREAGRDAGTVSLWATGGLVSSLRELRREKRANRITIAIGPGPTTSPSLVLTKTGARRTNRRSPPHGLLGYMHHTGQGRLPRRRWVGLTPKEEGEIAAALPTVPGALTSSR